MNYYQMKRKHEKELTDFEGLFYAFSNEQFKKGMEKIGLKEDDQGKIYSLGSGVCILKDKAKAFEDMFTRISEENEKALKDKNFLLEALSYELMNHEYYITGDLEPTFEMLGITIDDIKKLDFGMDILKKAQRSALNCA